MLYLWLLLYGLVFSLSGHISSLLCAGQWLTPLTMTVYTLLLLRWVCRTGQAQSVGFVIPHLQKHDWLRLLPLTLLPLGNRMVTSFPALSVFNVLLTLSICTAEELFFRGFLLSFLRQRCGLWSIFIASLIFSLFHCGNLLSGWDTHYVAMQMLLAFSTGAYLCLLCIDSGSLIPGIAAHFLINLTAGSLLTVGSSEALIIWGTCGVIHLICSLLLFQKIAAKYGG